MNDSHQPEVLIDREVLHHLLLVRLIRQPHEVVLDSVEGHMSPSDQVGQVLEGGRLVLDQYQEEVQREGRQRFLVACGVDRAQVRNALHGDSY